MGELLEDMYYVEKILAHRPKHATYNSWKLGQITKYYVKWQGYDDPADNTWEDAHHKEVEIPELIKAYWMELYWMRF